jgi:pilus assembly protein Flp/PilA
LEEGSGSRLAPILTIVTMVPHQPQQNSALVDCTRYRFGLGFSVGVVSGYVGLRQDSSQTTGRLMRWLAGKIRRFLWAEDGPTAAEYAIVLMLIFIVCITAIKLFGQKASSSFGNSSNSINTVVGG